ncbi:thrH, partial [Symbiodinium sp. KB8]
MGTDQKIHALQEEIDIHERDLVMVVLDVEGTLMPEAWLELQKVTGIEGLKRTTAHEPDYDKLMRYRINLLRENNIKITDMIEVVKDLKPLPGAREFLDWLKPLVPRILLLTDTFEEYAMPMPSGRKQRALVLQLPGGGQRRIHRGSHPETKGPEAKSCGVVSKAQLQMYRCGRFLQRCFDADGRGEGHSHISLRE